MLRSANLSLAVARSSARDDRRRRDPSARYARHPEPLVRLLHRRRRSRADRRLRRLRRARGLRTKTADHRGALVTTYLAYLHDAQQPDGWFHNFMGYDRRWQDRSGSGSPDAVGRAIWGLGYAERFAPRPSWSALAARCAAARSRLSRRWSTFARALYAALGLDPRAQSARPDDELGVRAVLDDAVRPIADAFDAHRAPDWEWCEDAMTYDNARLPEALLRGGAALGQRALRRSRPRDAALLYLGRDDRARRSSIRSATTAGIRAAACKAHLRRSSRSKRRRLVDAALAALRGQTGDPMLARRRGDRARVVLRQAIRASRRHSSAKAAAATGSTRTASTAIRAPNRRSATS
jgi:hypothetical protein